MPLSAADATKRRTKSAPTGREPTRKRPRSASASGVFVRASQRADPLPRALDAALDRGLEAAAARDLEVGEARRVEDLGESQLLGGRHHAGERLLSEQPDGRVDERPACGDGKPIARSAKRARAGAPARALLHSLRLVLVGTAAAARAPRDGDRPEAERREDARINLGDTLVVTLPRERRDVVQLEARQRSRARCYARTRAATSQRRSHRWRRAPPGIAVVRLQGDQGRHGRRLKINYTKTRQPRLPRRSFDHDLVVAPEDG